MSIGVILRILSRATKDVDGQGCQVDLENLENLENLEKGQKVAMDLEKTLKNDSNQGWTLKNLEKRKMTLNFAIIL